ncbi:MAG: DNA translocase FtsK 4TM domain-containing protein [Planctomycetota bacterium]|nr:DNA translocase FtsK 4TM domain-containing protein [Planctomycetota bacterium]
MAQSDRARTSRSSSSSRGASPGLLFRRGFVGFLALVWLFFVASLIGFNPADPPTHLVWPANPSPTNWCGPVGAHLSYYAFRFLGWGAWLGAAAAGLVLISLITGIAWRDLAVRVLGLALIVAGGSTMHNLLFPSRGWFPDVPGGVLGVAGGELLVQHFGVVGAGLWIGAGLLLGLVVAADDWIGFLFGWMRDRAVPAAVTAGAAAAPVVAKVSVATGRAAARAGGGFFGAMTRVFRRGAGAPRQHDLDDAPRDADRARSKGRGSNAIEDRDGLVDPDSGRRVRSKPRADEATGEQSPGAKPRRGRRGSADEAAQAEATTEAGANADANAEDASDSSSAGEPASQVEAKPRARGRRRAAQPPEPAGVSDDASQNADDDSGSVEDAIADQNRAGDDASVTDEADADPALDDELPGAPQVFDKDALRAKMARLPVVFGQRDVQVASDADLEGLQNVAELEGYRFPGLDLLENPEENFSLKLEEHVRDQGAALESALRQYKIDGEVVGIESGPVITLYHVKLAAGTKVAQITALDKDVARALKAVNIRIVSNMVGRDTIGIEVPNAQKEKVRLKELMSRPERYAKMKLPMFLGKDASGEALIADLTQMPHMLIAGTTGSGKSVCMNTIIMGFLYTKKPSELKLVLVDPKMVEMSQFKDIPHLMCPVVTEMSKAAAILDWACGKMDERYELLAEAGCRDIATYNDLAWEELRERLTPPGKVLTPEEEARIPRKLPYMVFIIDELADLMMTNKEVEGSIIRIAQKARAVGIHLILATQRPQANVVTGLIKSNMPARVAFKVASGMDSRIVLDQKGGELLLGYGDMLYLSPRTSKLLRAQGTLVDDLEIRKVVRFMREVASPSFERQLLSLRKSDGDDEKILESKNNSSASLAAAQEDPMFERAVEIVLETRRGSVSLLQRRLAIGYTRASRLVDLMGIAGIISDHKGSVARDVLITPEEWAAMKQLAAEEAAAQGLEWPPPPNQGELFPKGTGPGEALADAQDGPASAPEASNPETKPPESKLSASKPSPSTPAAISVSERPVPPTKPAAPASTKALPLAKPGVAASAIAARGAAGAAIGGAAGAAASSTPSKTAPAPSKGGSRDNPRDQDTAEESAFDDDESAPLDLDHRAPWEDEEPADEVADESDDAADGDSEAEYEDADEQDEFDDPDHTDEDDTEEDDSDDEDDGSDEGDFEASADEDQGRPPNRPPSRPSSPPPKPPSRGGSSRRP